MADDSVIGNAYAKKWRFSPEGDAAGNEISRASVVDGLTWIGFAGLRDQIRPGARELVDRLHRAGITTVMLTGDQPLTARAVALQIGLAAPGRLQVLDTRELDEALSLRPDFILLDNMSPDELREAVRRTNGRVPLEASGGINLDTVRAVAETGVDRISVGALTHSVTALDISMRVKV